MELQNQHKDAFLRWYEPLHSRFLRYCASRAFGILDAEDLVQEAILATLAQWKNIKDKDKLLSYMIGVVNNILRNQLRRKKFQGVFDEKQLEVLHARIPDPETALDVQYLLKAMQQLPKVQQEAFMLFEVSGFSIKEIAAIQQSSEGAVKTRLSRTRKVLKKLLQEDGRPMTIGQRLTVYASVML